MDEPAAVVSTPGHDRNRLTAQVAPLPRVDGFSVGSLLGDVTKVAKATREDEVSYIPVALARAHLARVVQDMHAMQEDHAAKLTQIVDRYKTIEAETKRFYENHISELKERARSKFHVEQERYKALETESEAKEQRARERLEELEDAIAQRLHQHRDDEVQWMERAESRVAAYEEELTRFHDRVQQSVESALRSQYETLHASYQTDVDHLRTEWEQARTECQRAADEIKTMRTLLSGAQAQHESELRGFKLDAVVELEAFRCLAAIVNRVVDMEEHVRRRKRSRELKGEITALERKAKESTLREQLLAGQLGELTAQYDALEQRAVGQTVEMMLRTIELTPLEASEKSEPRELVGESFRPKVVQSETQTAEWAAVLAANTPKQPVEMRDAAVETRPESTPPQPETTLPCLDLPTTPAPQLQYEADAERFRERNAELVHSKQDLMALKAEMQACADRKNDAKARIKQWLSEFQKLHKRDPTIEEKAQVKDLYLAFKVSEEAFNAARNQVTKAKARHHELVVEIETLSQWHALAASALSTSRSDAMHSRPGTAASVDDSTASLGTITAGPVAEITKLEHEIDLLRSELTKVYTDKDKADSDASEAILEAKRANADTKRSADRLAEAEAKIREHEREAQQREDVRRQNTEHQQLDVYARESEEIQRQQSELQASIASLRDEIATRSAEKQALETQIEHLRLHVELMDGHDEDLLGSDAKGGSRAKIPTDAADEEDEEVGENGDEEGDDATAEAKTSETLSPSKSATAPLTEAERAEGVRETQLMAQIRESIEAGKAQWNRGDKAKCFQIYIKMSEKCIDTLRMPPPGRREEVAAFRSALQEASRLAPAKGSMVLRRQLDNCLAACEARGKERDAKEAAAIAAAASPQPRSAATTPSSSPQRKTPHKKSLAPPTGDSGVTEDKPTTTPLGGTKALEEYKQKLKVVEVKAKVDKVRITQLEAALSKAETQLTTASASGGSGGGPNAVVLERKFADAEKRHAKALEEAEKTLKRDIATVTQQLSASQTKSQTLQDQVDKLTKELVVAGGRATQLGKMEEEVAALRAKAGQVDALSQDLAVAKGELTKLETSYKEEQALRKKYYNMIEDMKGKIRVYARCRPMSSTEIERGCDACVRFVDEFSLELKTSHGPKTFAYDQVFTPASTQDQVFEDTKNLLQSAVDGYNVCIFAYGQTGSGKTFTMTGTESHPGLSPRVIHHLFRLAAESSSNNTITFQAFMLELYNDNLIDLFHLVDGGSHDQAPKLDIKKNDRGMVFVSNISTKSCSSAQQTLKLFEAANKKRQVGATKMNAESSRSHSIFSILVENVNKTTKTTSIGKLSLVDLAGSERAGKTGATNDRLKEAQAINKSLSALGDVIAALSSGEKFIPYRNNKLTQLMQDSLGGNAKTLMFVNISPADYNQEETQTSLQYASRVKLITNNANKTSESETVNRLKAVIKHLRAGRTDVELEGLGID